MTPPVRANVTVRMAIARENSRNIMTRNEERRVIVEPLHPDPQPDFGLPPYGGGLGIYIVVVDISNVLNLRQKICVCGQPLGDVYVGCCIARNRSFEEVGKVHPR